jgi:hypothetical protein
LKNDKRPLEVSYVTEKYDISMNIINELEFRKWIKFSDDSKDRFVLTDLGMNTGIYKLSILEFGGNIWETTIYSEWLKVL